MKNTLRAFLFVAAACLCAEHAHAQLIIASPSAKASDVSKSELKDVFTGSATSLKDGARVIAVILKSGTTNDEFLAAYVGKADAAFRANWRSLVFSGQATMPKQVDSDAAMVEYVAHNPGAIGYIGKGSAHEGVKVLVVK